MVAAGPRVGGAHVDVNMKFDDKSLKDVGRQIHKQLTDVSERNTQVYRAIGRDAVTAWRGALGAILTGAPLIGSAISAASGGITVLAGSLYSLSQTSFAALPIFTSLGIAGLTASIGMRNFSAAVSEVDPKKLALLLKDMPKSMQEAVLSTRALSNEMRAAIWPKLFAGLSGGIDSLRNTGVIQKGLGSMAESINGLVKGLLGYANTKKGISTIDKFLQNNAKVFAGLSKAAVPFLDGFLRLVNALTPAALRLTGRITDVGKSFQSWTRGEGFGKRMDDMMKRAEKTAGLLIDVFVNVYKAVVNIFNIANPSSNNLLTMLVNATDRFREFTEGVDGQNSIAKWAQASVDVLGQFGRTAEEVFKVIAELADPRVITSFLATVEGAFAILGQLPLDKMVDAFVTVAEVLQPVSSAFLAIIIGGAALNIMIGSVIGQFAGLFGVLAGIVKFKILVNILKNTSGGSKAAGAAAAGAAKKVGIFSRAWGFLKSILDKIRGALSKVFPFMKKTGDATGDVAGKASRLSGAFKPFLTVLGRLAKFAGFAGIAVWIGTLIKRSKMLQEKFGKVWESMKGVGTEISDAFSRIVDSLKPLAPVADKVGDALGPIFDFIDKIATIGIGLVLDTVIYAFESLGNVIEGVSKIIAGGLDIIIGLFTLDGSKMLDGLKKLGSGIKPLLEGLFGLFVTFFAPAKLFRLAGLAFKGLGSGIKGALPGILSFLGNFVVRILKFFLGLAPKLLRLGGSAIRALGGAIAKNAPRVLAAAGRIAMGVVKWIGRLPGRLLSLGKTAVTKLAGAVSKGVPVLAALAGRIVKGVIGFIGKLPGRLFDLGKSAVTKLGTAVRGGLTRVKNAAGAVFRGVWNAVKDLPGQMLNLGKSIIGGLVDGILDKLGDLKDAAGKIGGAIKGFLPGSPVKDGPLTAWNHGGGASGGGRNVIDAITGGLKDTDPIRKAMSGVAEAVASSLVPRVTPAGNVPTRTTRVETGRTPDSGGNVYIAKMMPHNYGEFEKQMQQRQRLRALGGRAS